MDFIKRHYFFTLWVIAVVASIFLKIPFSYVLLGSIVYLLLVLLIRLPSTVCWIGYILQARMGKKETALKMYEFGYKHGARPAAPMITYGMQLLNNGRYKEGLDVLEEVVTEPKLNATFLKIARQDLAIAYWCNDDLDTAISTLEKMREDYDFLSTDFYTTLAYFYIEKGDHVTAEEINNEALNLDESCGPAYDNLAQIRYREGDLAESEELFLKALDLKDTMASSKFYLGLIAEQKGDVESARMYFTAAHESKITGINTVTREEVDAKYQEYLNA